MKSSGRPIITAMRREYLRWALILVLGVMLGGHVTELFDHWDHTLQTGRDVDYTVVIIAACVGVVFAVGKKFVAACVGVFSRANLLQVAAPKFNLFLPARHR